MAVFHLRDTESIYSENLFHNHKIFKTILRGCKKCYFIKFTIVHTDNLSEMNHFHKDMLTKYFIYLYEQLDRRSFKLFLCINIAPEALIIQKKYQVS